MIISNIKNCERHYLVKDVNGSKPGQRGMINSYRDGGKQEVRLDDVARRREMYKIHVHNFDLSIT